MGKAQTIAMRGTLTHPTQPRSAHPPPQTHGSLGVAAQGELGAKTACQMKDRPPLEPPQVRTDSTQQAPCAANQGSRRRCGCRRRRRSQI